jgi:hypothetical protein
VVSMFLTESTDLSFLTLSTTPIQKLWIDYDMLYPKPVSLLVSIFPSLVHLVVNVYDVESRERVRLYLSIYYVNTKLVNRYRCWALTNIL